MKPELKAVISTLQRRLDAATVTGKPTLRVKTHKLALLVHTVNSLLAYLEEVERQEADKASGKPTIEAHSYGTGYREGWNACRAAVIVGIPEARKE